VPRVILLLPTTTYRASDFLAAAAKVGADVTVASEEPSTLASRNPAGLLTLDFRNPEECAARVVRFSREHPVNAIVGVDEETALAAAAIARALGLAGNSPRAAAAARDKALLREALAAAGVASPRSRTFRVEDGPEDAAAAVTYPCVLKPTFLAGSRGVIRANDPGSFRAAWARIASILGDPEVAKRGGEAARQILVEQFVPGAEVAVEGLLTDGSLEVLAVFDKPDPLDGPYFEETIYVTPSRLPGATQDAVRETTEMACRALGLVHGPIHAELRLGPDGPVVIEVAARSIGGLCSRTLTFGTGLSLEEVIVRHALGARDETARRESAAAGVLMIPIPRAGCLESVRGLEAARAVPGVVDAVISAHVGQELVPLPEGSRYLGFLFSRAPDPARAESVLREAHAKLEFLIR
jgi:biotin carboxylase